MSDTDTPARAATAGAAKALLQNLYDGGDCLGDIPPTRRNLKLSVESLQAQFTEIEGQAGRVSTTIDLSSLPAERADLRFALDGMEIELNDVIREFSEEYPILKEPLVGTTVIYLAMGLPWLICVLLVGAYTA